MLKNRILCCAVLFSSIVYASAASAGTLVFEAEEEEEIIIVDEEPSSNPYGFDFDLTALGSETAIAASIFLDLRDDDNEGESAVIVIEDFTGAWSAVSGSPATGFSSTLSSPQILTAINQEQMLHVEIQASLGGFSYYGSTLTVTTIPEPRTAFMLALGVGATNLRIRRNRTLAHE